MRREILMLVLVTFMISAYNQRLATVVAKPSEGSESVHARHCEENRDARYSRAGLLMEFENVLKQSVPAFRQSQHLGFFVVDLSDPLNRYIPGEYAAASPCIEFSENHIYHFAPISLINSQSHIAVLIDGKTELFRNVNCKNGENSIEDVIRFVEQKLPNEAKSEEIIERVNGYRKYGFYVAIDETNVRCYPDAEEPTPMS